MNVPLTPLRFLTRAEQQFGAKVGVIDGERSWTYSELAARCRRLAGLLQQLELSPGGRVAFLGGNTHQLLEAYYGVPLAGGVLLPLNIRLTGPDFASILADAGAEILLLEADFVPTVEPIVARLPRLRHCIQLDGRPGENWLHPGDAESLLQACSDRFEWGLADVDEDMVAEIFYTSATTGEPKGVLLTHRNLYLHALSNLASIRRRESDVHLHAIGLFHANGWGAPQSLTAIGATHVMLHRFRAGEALRTIEQHRVTTMNLVPTMAAALLEHPAARQTDLSGVRLIVLGGAASTPSLIGELEETFGCQCIGGYGLTETAPVVGHADVKSHLDLSTAQARALKATAGFPTLQAEVQIRGDSGEPLPWDGRAVGELLVRGDGVMAGYWGRSEPATLDGGWLPTGDLASISPDGYITIVDRSKDIIISGGENISSLEVERTLAAHPAVSEAAVFAVPDPQWGESPRACVVLKRDKTATEDELIAFCRDSMAHFKCPKTIELRDELPKGGTGKVLKRKLREPFWQDRDKRVN